MTTTALTKREVEAFYGKLDADFPNPGYDHPPVNDYQALVAVLLSAQSTAIGVERATTPLFERVSNPAQMMNLGEDALREQIATLGLFRTKARHVIALSQILLDQHGGEVPKERQSLLALPGVGPKTADVVLNALFGKPTIGVDTHIFRVCNRTGLALGPNAKFVSVALGDATPDRYAMSAHNLLFTLGREICKARKPDCWRCPVVKICHYDAKVLTA